MNVQVWKISRAGEVEPKWMERLRKREEFRARHGGYRLAAYHWEREAYPEFRKVQVEKSRAMFYLKKLSRHFKTSCPALSHIKKRGGGHYQRSQWNPSIALSANPSLGLICHEYAHHLTHIRYPNAKQSHGREFKRELKKVYTFAKRYLPTNTKSDGSLA